MNRELEALSSLHVSTALTLDELWTSVSSYHVDGLHAAVSGRLARSIGAVEQEKAAPIAAVVLGERGSGKTHLLGWTRHEIQARGGFFFLIKLGRDFWESATGSLVDSLYRKDEGGHEQLLRLLEGLSRLARVDTVTRAAVTGARALTRAHLDAFVKGIRTLDRQVGNEAADTARALALIASSGEAVEVGSAYFALNDDDLGQRTAWGLSSKKARQAQFVLRDLTRLFALAGPLVFAFDQLDNLVSVSETSLASPAVSGESREASRLSNDIATGLMNLREEARRTLMVVACLPDTWEKIRRAATRSALDRFDVLPELGPIPDEATAAAIVSSRFREGYESIGFTPQYPTWPINRAALAQAPLRYTARRLLLRVVEHINECLQTGMVAELTSLAPKEPIGITPLSTPADTGLEELAESFDRLRSEADETGPLDKATEDRFMPGLLGAGLRSLIKELGGDETRFLVEINFGRKAALHARLRYIVDEASENELHWSFRAIAADNARAVQTRMRNAMVEAGLEAGLASRRLILLRNTPYPSGAKTEQLRDEFGARGGRSLPLEAADLRTLAALHRMLDDPSPSLDVWLQRERPAAGTVVFAAVVDDLRPHLGPAATAAVTDDTPATESGSADPADGPGPLRPEITIGTTARGNRPLTVATEQLTMHTAVVGASGSGKTVLVKRIVEQCALRGVSSIVLDPNDDLGRLGDPWPGPPEGWTDEHEDEARRYFAETEVVVWTPGLNRGRPLSFNPLPDFGPVLGDEDDLARLLTSAVATLAPQAGVQGRSARAIQQEGVLQRALDWYVRDGGRTMAGFVELLADPPAEVANRRTRLHAVQMADTLEAAIATDRLLDESGTPTDPGLLLTPSPGRSARVSVISFVGLTGGERVRFVSRLQTALFSWFRAHPTKERRLGGLLVMDEAQNFVPSGAANPSTDSTVDLIRQVRKYGLGVVLASQAPKGIHNQALGNAANQFIGRLTVPAQIAAAEQMAQRRNSTLDDLGGLPLGTFYAAGEGTTFSKIQVPNCLSHHAEPLREEEVVERARRGG